MAAGRKDMEARKERERLEKRPEPVTVESSNGQAEKPTSEIKEATEPEKKEDTPEEPKSES